MSQPERAHDRAAEPTAISRRQALVALAGLGVGAIGVTGCGRRRGPRIRIPRSRPTRDGGSDAAAGP